MTETSTTTTEEKPPSKKLKLSESDVYDRQIRLWGADAQASISKTKILYLHLSGVSCEVLKNLVLAGVQAAVCDGRPVASLTETPCFFLERPSTHNKDDKTVAEAVQSKVTELNPLLGDCQIFNTPLEELTSEFLKDFDIVIASRLGPDEALQLKKKLPPSHKLFLVDCFGWNGAAVLDLGPNHRYREELPNKALSEWKSLDTYVPLNQLLQLPLDEMENKTKRQKDKPPPAVWKQYRTLLYYKESTKTWPTAQDTDKFVKMAQEWAGKDEDVFGTSALQDLCRVGSAEVSPVCAVMGGMVGNEVIKAISGKGAPAQNVLLLDGKQGKCRSVLMQPRKKEEQ